MSINVAPSVAENVRTDGQVSEAVWNFLTSIKAVNKRGGREEAFDATKLKRSVEMAMQAAGLNDQARAGRIAGQIISRLQRIYDGHSTPASADIREVVAMTLIDNNLVYVAKKYSGFRQALLPRGTASATYGQGLDFKRYLTKEGVHPYEQVEWEMRTAKITNEKNEVIFEQNNIETPKTWTQTATNIVAQKYFRGKVGTPERETSMKQLISRVADTISDWGRKDGYFQSAHDAQVFQDELTFILINQMCAFNSPVWFNVGINPHPQCSACFINSVEDDMRSILHLTTTESMLFKGGSGTGSNLSKLRSSHEYLGGSNGRSSGPVSFMKGLDAFAGIVKSGGKTRRAAKMVILNVDHPDVVSFIECKAKEELKAWALVDAGYDSSMDGEAYGSVFFQNANNSVRVTDDFMKAVEADGEWVTHEVTTGQPSLKYRARELFKKMAEAAWQCGDPGIQYDTTVNKWHTCKNTDRINASNPCSEYMFLDDSACNLASLNLMKFRKEVNGLQEFDAESFKAASAVVITAMEILVGNSSYPTPAIEQNSHDYRPLGIGFANLGALLMSRGVAYDSQEGRNLAAAIMALLSGHTYYQSAKIAERMSPAAGFALNREPWLEVIGMHRQAAYEMDATGVSADLMFEARKSWDNALDHGTKHGLRNAQISVLAPTGTIAFLMDCDTTGIEPDIALVKYKWLVGGGMMKIVNNTIPEALSRLGYTAQQAKEILAHIDQTDSIEGAPHLKEEHLPIFDCAFKAKNGTRTIHYIGHLRMMSAVQPFISGAISKTVNMPNESTVADIEKVYLEGWKMGLKAIAIYRDGSKRQQALTTSKEKDASKKVVAETVVPRRRRLPDERRAITHKFQIGSHKGYITVGLYDDGKPGELFVTMAKEGSVISGLMDSFAAAVSIGLQYGVPMPVLVNKFVHMRFEPSGFTSNPNIRVAKSIVDYIFRWMALKFLGTEDQKKVGINNVTVEEAKEEAKEEVKEEVKANSSAAQVELFNMTSTFDNTSDAPACDSCGSIMVRNAACYKCLNCGSTSGCS
jgi:ribonucleoside-diphosphate reductase alpha chain